MDIHDLDLNLLVAFDAMMGHRSVTRAAHSIGLSQPAMSAALGRLRTLLGDPLFVKAGHGMQPTPRALAMAEPVQRVMATVRSEILHSGTFDASESTRRFNIVMPDLAEAQFLPLMLGRLAQVAPGVRVRTMAMPPLAATGALESGTADLAVGSLPDLKKGSFMQQRLFRDSCACIVREHHALGRGPGHDRMSLKEYLAAQHVVVLPHGREHVFESFLARRGIRRDVVLEVTNFMSVLPIVAQSDLVATVPMALARVCAAHAGIRIALPPFKPPTVDIHQYWHTRMHKDAANVWLRRLLQEIFQRT